MSGFSGTIPPANTLQAYMKSNAAFGLGPIENLTLTASVAANALTIAVKAGAVTDATSTDLVPFVFRSPTAATGDYTRINLTGASSLVVSSDSTLGTVNSTAFRLWIVMFNDGGTLRLGVINCSTSALIYPLQESIVASSTAEGGAGAADSAGVFYTGTAVTARAFRIIGLMDWESGLATAGAWSAGPTRIQLFGPGVRLPGAVIQTVLGTTSSSTANSTTTYSDAVSASITPTSAANLIRVTVSGSGMSSAAGVSCIVAIRRGTTALGPIAYLYSGAGSIYAGSTLGPYIDKPNTTASTTYNGSVKSGTGGTTVRFPDDASTYAHVLVEELMG